MKTDLNFEFPDREQKVLLIYSINNAHKRIFNGDCIDTIDFDRLYELPVDELYRIACAIELDAHSAH